MNKLAELRATAGLTVRQLAEESKVSPTTINRLERGKIKSHPVTIGRLARILGVSLADLAEFIATEDELPKKSRLNNLSTQAA